MRKREEIEKNRDTASRCGSTGGATAMFTGLLLEVTLDIRDLLQKNQIEVVGGIEYPKTPLPYTPSSFSPDKEN